MILLHQYRFTVAAYYQRVDPEQAAESMAQGLVVPVELTFEFWLNGRSNRAEAFLDPGADRSIISLRWISEQAEATGSGRLVPQMDPSGFIDEAVELSIAGKRMSLGDSDRPVWVAPQGDHVVAGRTELPGYEDMLLGRDFITQHGLLILIDGEEKCFSLLAPSDPDNRRRREHIRDAFGTNSHFDVQMRAEG